LKVAILMAEPRAIFLAIECVDACVRRAWAHSSSLDAGAAV